MDAAVLDRESQLYVRMKVKLIELIYLFQFDNIWMIEFLQALRVEVKQTCQGIASVRKVMMMMMMMMMIIQMFRTIP